jgi:hypothetical protein
VYTLNPAAEVDIEEGGPAADDAVDIPEDDDSGDTEVSVESTQTPSGDLSGLHAKTYLVDAGNRGHIWVGSANATNAAFGRNIEFLVQLSGHQKECGIDAIFDPDDHALWNMLQPHVPPAEPPEPDELQAKLEQRLSDVQRAIATCPLTLSVVDKGGSTFDVALKATRPLLDGSDTSIAVSCRPITLRDHYRQAVDINKPLVEFCHVSFDALTSFFVFHVELTIEGKHGDCEFVLNIPMDGEPPDRRERLLLALLKDANHVLKYLLMLLADDGWDARKALDVLEGEQSGTDHHPKDSEFGLPLLEPMLRALARDPAKLECVAQLVGDLSKTPEGRAMIPEGFDRIWLPIWRVKEGNKK